MGSSLSYADDIGVAARYSTNPASEFVASCAETHAGADETRWNGLKTIIFLISLIAFLIALSIALAGPAARFGLWDYGEGLAHLRRMSNPALAAAGAAGVGFIASVFSARLLAPFALIAALSAAAGGYAPLEMKKRVKANPFIHDVTTNFENPPTIVVAADAQRKNPVGYVGDKPVRDSALTVAEAQRDAFPDISPIFTAKGVDGAADIARDVLASMGMRILSDGANDAGWKIEASHTSFWFGFVDDFVVRISLEDGQTRIDLRSKSRVGGSDLGANANRVRDFIKRFNAADA